MMVINAWSWYFVELLSRSVCQLQYRSTHFLHDPPYHRTTKRYSDFPSMVVFQLLRRKFWIQTWFCNCQQYLCLFHIVFEYTADLHDQGKMLVLPNQLLCWVLSTSDQCFVSFQPIWCHPHTQIRITIFHGVRISIPNWKPSPNRTPKGFSQIAFHIIVLPKDDHTDFAQEERLDLPYFRNATTRRTDASSATQILKSAWSRHDLGMTKRETRRDSLQAKCWRLSYNIATLASEPSSWTHTYHHLNPQMWATCGRMRPEDHFWSTRPEERQSNRPLLLGICEAELEDGYGDERDQHQTGRQLLIPSPLKPTRDVSHETLAFVLNSRTLAGLHGQRHVQVFPIVTNTLLKSRWRWMYHTTNLPKLSESPLGRDRTATGESSKLVFATTTSAGTADTSVDSNAFANEIERVTCANKRMGSATLAHIAVSAHQYALLLRVPSLPTQVNIPHESALITTWFYWSHRRD